MKALTMIGLMKTPGIGPMKTMKNSVKNYLVKTNISVNLSMTGCKKMDMILLTKVKRMNTNRNLHLQAQNPLSLR